MGGVLIVGASHGSVLWDVSVYGRCPYGRCFSWGVSSYGMCLPIGGVLWDVFCYNKKAKLRLARLVREFCIFTVFLLNISSADRIRFSLPPRNA